VEPKRSPNEATITSVLARSVSVPLDNPTSFSTRNVTAREYTLVRTLSEDAWRALAFVMPVALAASSSQQRCANCSLLC
jgi:hypothetical protein